MSLTWLLLLSVTFLPDPGTVSKGGFLSREMLQTELVLNTDRLAGKR